jgi:hydroxymethylbilane synthase
MKRLTIGTRGSKLALWQANHVADALRALVAELEVELQVIKTQGDKILDVPLAKLGGKGLFVKEIEDALLCHEIDLAVHSIKDVPAELPAGLQLSCIPEREDPRDVWISPHGAPGELAAGARVGTSSLRRSCLLRALRSDLEIISLRGNVDTRLRKLDEGQVEAIILAAAGVRRLGLADRIRQPLETSWLPAIGQGALGIETRSADETTNSLVARLHHPHSATCVRAERAFLARLGGGCQVPIGGHARLHDGVVELSGMVGHPSGSPVYRGSIRGSAAAAEDLGRELAERLLAEGAGVVLEELYG